MHRLTTTVAATTVVVGVVGVVIIVVIIVAVAVGHPSPHLHTSSPQVLSGCRPPGRLKPRLVRLHLDGQTADPRTSRDDEAG